MILYSVEKTKEVYPSSNIHWKGNNSSNKHFIEDTLSGKNPIEKYHEIF